MKQQDKLAFILTISLIGIFALQIIGIIFLTYVEKDVPPILGDLCKITGGAFAGYIGGVARAYFS